MNAVHGKVQNCKLPFDSSQLIHIFLFLLTNSIMSDDAIYYITTSKPIFKKLYINLTFGYLIYSAHFFIKLNIPKVLFKIKRKKKMNVVMGVMRKPVALVRDLPRRLFLSFVYVLNLFIYLSFMYFCFLDRPTDNKI